MTTLTNSLNQAAASRTADPSAAADGRAPQHPISEQEAAAFERAVSGLSVQERPEGSPQGSPMAKQGKAKGEASSSQAELSAIFSSLMSGQSSAQAAAPQTPVQTAPLQTEAPSAAPGGGLQDLVDNLVERILVSDPKFSSGSEVRLLLSGSAGSLSGAEIVLRRDLEGLLAVEINCRSRDQFKKFVEIRGELSTALERHERGRLNLSINEAAPDEEEDAERRQSFSPEDYALRPTNS